MNLSELRSFCLSFPGVQETYPFGPDTVVFKVMGRMFLLTQNDPNPVSVNLKCDPDDALALRKIFKGVLPGYHMNKKHWNTVMLNADVPREEIAGQIGDSYQYVVNRLPQKKKEALALWLRGEEIGRCMSENSRD